MKVSGVFKLVVTSMPMLIGFLMVAGILGLRTYFFFRRLSRHREQTEQAQTEGKFAPPSFHLGKQLPAQYEALASVGIKSEAPVTVGDRILRPAIGVRLFVLGLAAAILTLVVQPGLLPSAYDEAIRELPVSPEVTRIVLLVAALWSVAYIFGFEARYNADTLIVTRLFKRREYRWKNLLWLKDDGGYDLILTFETGKAKVLKHTVGVDQFKAFAEQQAQINRTLDARTARS